MEEDFSVSEFVEEMRSKYERTQNELREMDVLIKQSSAEVERLAQRNAQISNYVSQLKIDTAPREDIKEGYEALQDVQKRLYTMRGQLEKLQSDQRNLRRLADTQESTLQIVGTLDFSVDDGQGNESSRADRSNVVRVVQSEELTRQSLVRKMHDGPASSLSNFILQAEICERLFDSSPGRAREELHALKDAAASTFNKVKDFIFDLRPMMLDDLGVAPTLRSYVSSFKDKSGIPVSLSLTGSTDRRLPSHIEVTVFRAVQELINNARAHGDADQIDVQLEMAAGQVKAVVEDNGRGFNPDEVFVQKDGQHRTIGLPTLRERLEMLGGRLDINSQIGRGTTSQFVIPLNDDGNFM